MNGARHRGNEKMRIDLCQPEDRKDQPGLQRNGQ